MKLASVRKIGHEIVDAHALINAWQHLGLECAYEALPDSEMLVAITASLGQDEWSGFIDLDAWLGATSPGLASLARHGNNSLDHVMALFSASARPLSLPKSLPALAYTHIKVKKVKKEDRRNNYLSLMTPQGKLWLSSASKLTTNSLKNPTKPDVRGAFPLSTLANDVPLTLAFVIGHSTMSQALLKTVGCGDVLLVKHIAFRVTTQSATVGQFMFTEEGSLAVQAHYQEDHEKVDAGLVGHIPVRVDFILQRRTMTVLELDQLYRGEFLAFDPQAEKTIELSVGGVKVATGELVELDGQLGVELKEITRS